MQATAKCHPTMPVMRAVWSAMPANPGPAQMMQAMTLPECHQTGADIEGPFYRPNVPIRNELDLYGDAGTRLALSGRVLDLSCNPIPNAVVDIWHAAPTAVAVQDLQVSDAVDYDNTSSEMRYRGQTATDAQGRYSFHTKNPVGTETPARFAPCTST